SSQAISGDEDDEMEDVDETGVQGGASLSVHQGQTLNPSPQYYLQDRQAQGSVQEGCVIPNVYQDINAQLRAAFLARAEMDRSKRR
ncbi:hypothetical protein BGX28_000758, partial [Mortierella sp. GBA30]